MDMEPQQQQQLQQQQQPNEDSGNSKGSSFLCRQSSTRWTPTTDQIRILKDLYYNNGVRSPSAEQIQRISARLRQYGKIEGKNVFYWFQNHKARERQKKRFTSDHHIPIQRSLAVPNPNPGCWRPDHDPIHNKFHSIPTPPGISSPSSSSSPTMLAVGQMGSFGYGSVERSFTDCSISGGGGRGGVVGGSINQGFEWVGMDPYSSSYAFFDKRKSMGESFEEEEEEEQEEEEEAAPEIETLPLFPMHAEDINGFCNIKPESEAYYAGWYRAAAAAAADAKTSSRTSLELSLNSYAGDSP